MRTTIGVEEEFMLLDPATLAPVPRAGDAVLALRDSVFSGSALDGGKVTPEFFPSQIEYATPVCSSASEAHASLTAFRAALSAWAADAGLIAAGVGTPYRVDPDAHVSQEDRYTDIASHFGLIVPDHQINGLHVHVGVADRDAAVRGLNRLRPWLPTLLALSANSPYWNGADTGFASWRAIHSRRWTTHGIPPPFRDAADYDARTAALRGIGGTTDSGTLNWVARPSEHFPTVEVRVFDAQLDAETSVALAALVRGLVTSDDHVAAPAPAPELIDAALWHAARDGLDGDLVDARDGSIRPAAAVVQALIDAASTGLADHGDEECVRATVERVLREGNGATSQRDAVTGRALEKLAAVVAVHRY